MRALGGPPLTRRPQLGGPRVTDESSVSNSDGSVPSRRPAERVEAALRAPAVRLLGGIACVILFALLLLHLGSLWRENPVDLDETSPWLLALAFLVTLASVVAMMIPWANDLRALGTEPPRGLLAACLVGQLAKYVPGGIWPLLGRMGLANRLGVPLRAGGASLAMESILVLGAVAAFAPLALAGTSLPAALPYVGSAAVLVAAAAAMRSARVVATARALLSRAGGGPVSAIRLRPARRALLLYIAGWALTGVGFWLTAAALFGTPLSDLPLYAGAFAVAWATGYVIVFAPGGLGVREVVLVALLRPSLGETEALLLAATSRIAFTMSDLVAAAAALPVLRVRLRAAAREPVVAGADG